jgi:hypothetical protein
MVSIQHYSSLALITTFDEGSFSTQNFFTSKIPSTNNKRFRGIVSQDGFGLS